MKSPSANVSQIYPTMRLAAAFAAGSLFFFAIPWVGPIALWLGIIYDLSLFTATIVDYLRLQDSKACKIERERVTSLSIGEHNPIWVKAVHRGTGPIRAVVRDEPPTEFEVSSRILTFDLNPGDSVRKNYRVFPEERGYYMFEDVNVRFLTELGLLTIQVTIPSQMPIKVYPNIFQTQKHKLLSRENRVSQMGLRRSRIHGHGREFERLREYLPDDSIRDVDWKATARRGVPITREYDVEQSQNIMILLDLGRNMASRTVEPDGKLGITKADCAINAAVFLAHVAAQSDDRVGLLCFAREPIAYVPMGKGTRQAARLLNALYALRPRIEEPNYYQAFFFAREKQRKRCLFFIFTDLIDSEASNRLISSMPLLVGKHLVVCAALADYELPSIIETIPSNPAEMYTQAVAISMARERKKALLKLTAQGVVAIDATPSDLSISTVNKYLQFKREGRL